MDDPYLLSYRLSQVFATPAEATAWLNKPNRHLNHLTPAQAIFVDGGYHLVMRALKIHQINALLSPGWRRPTYTTLDAQESSPGGENSEHGQGPARTANGAIALPAPRSDREEDSRH